MRDNRDIMIPLISSEIIGWLGCLTNNQINRYIPIQAIIRNLRIRGISLHHNLLIINPIVLTHCLAHRLPRNLKNLRHILMSYPPDPRLVSKDAFPSDTPRAFQQSTTQHNSTVISNNKLQNHHLALPKSTETFREHWGHQTTWLRLIFHAILTRFIRDLYEISK